MAVSMRRRSWMVSACAAACMAACATAAGQATAGEPGQARGALTIDGATTPLTHAVRTTRPNTFNDFFTDTVVVLSTQPLTPEEAAAERTLASRAARGEIATIALRFDGRPRRGQLFNVAINHQAVGETVLLPDVWFTYTFKGGAGTLVLARREFAGRTYAIDAAFTVVMPVETTAADLIAGRCRAAAAEQHRRRSRARLDPADRRAAGRRRAAVARHHRARHRSRLPRSQDGDSRSINWAVLMCQPPVVDALVDLKADLSHERLPGMTLLAEARAACPDAVGFLRAGGAQ